MKTEEFHAWFLQHIDEMLAMGVAHPNSQAGRWIQLALGASGSTIVALEERVRVLEEELSKLKKPKSRKKNG